MRQIVLAALFCLVPVAIWAESATPVIRNILDEHILPGFETLSARSQVLTDVAAENCMPTSAELLVAYHDAFDAWVSVSHLRFGPTEKNDGAFALAFWPDSRGATPRTLSAFIADQDPIATSPDSYRDASIAARGFYALEFLLYDEDLKSAGDAGYRCQLVRTIATDIANISNAIIDDWKTDYANSLLHPAPDGVYRKQEEALHELFKALTTGLQFTSETRLGRPLGTFERPRPTRAEARRSGRSASHVMLSLRALRDLASRLAAADADLAKKLDKRFETAETKLDALNDPIFAGTAHPQTRLKVEIVQQAVDSVRATVRDELGPALGVASGFNSLDGD